MADATSVIGGSLMESTPKYLQQAEAKFEAAQRALDEQLDRYEAALADRQQAAPIHYAAGCDERGPGHRVIRDGVESWAQGSRGLCRLDPRFGTKKHVYPRDQRCVTLDELDYLIKFFGESFERKADYSGLARNGRWVTGIETHPRPALGEAQRRPRAPRRGPPARRRAPPPAARPRRPPPSGA